MLLCHIFSVLIETLSKVHVGWRTQKSDYFLLGSVGFFKRFFRFRSLSLQLIWLIIEGFGSTYNINFNLECVSATHSLKMKAIKQFVPAALAFMPCQEVCNHFFFKLWPLLKWKSHWAFFSCGAVCYVYCVHFFNKSIPKFDLWNENNCLMLLWLWSL